MKKQSATVFQVLTILERMGLFRLTPREVLRIETMLAARERWSPRSRAVALASLLAADADGWQAIHDRLLEMLGDEDEDIAETPRSPAEAEAGREVFGASGETDDTRDTTPKPPDDTGHPSRRGRALPWALAIASVATLAIVLGVLSSDESGDPDASVTMRADAAPAPIDVSPPDAASVPVSVDAGVPDAAPVPIDAGLPDAAELTPAVAVPAIPPEPPPEAPAVGAWPGWLLVAGLALVAVLLLWLGVRGMLLPTARSRERRRARVLRSRLLRGAGNPAVPYHVERAAPLPREALDDAATILGRVRSEDTGHDLDIAATLDRTARAAGRLTPIYAPSHRADTLLVLIDVEKGDHPFVEAVDWILAYWRTIGLRLVRHDYRFTPTVLFPEGGGTVAVDKLARHAAGMPLLMFSRLRHMGSMPGRPAPGAAPPGIVPWLRGLAPWPARVLVDLDPTADSERPRQERHTVRACAAADLPRYPFTRTGLVAAARALATGYAPAEPKPLLPSVHELDDSLRLWAAAAACVPDPGWAQLESLRREFAEISSGLPERGHVQRLIEWVELRHRELGVSLHAVEGADGEHLAMHPTLRHELTGELDGSGTSADSFAAEVRQFLMEQLRRAKPRSEFERGLIELKLAYHRAALDREQTARLLADFRGGPYENELRQMLRELNATDRGDACPARVRAEVAGFLAPGRAVFGRALVPVQRSRGRMAVRPGVRSRGRWALALTVALALALAAASVALSLRVESPDDADDGVAAVLDSADSELLDRIPAVRLVTRKDGGAIAADTGDPPTAPTEQPDAATPAVAARPVRGRDAGAAPARRPPRARPDAGEVVVLVDEPASEPPVPRPATGVTISGQDTPDLLTLPSSDPLDQKPTGRRLGWGIEALKGKASMRFVKLSAGEFTMGSPDSDKQSYPDERPRRRVWVSAFEIAEAEVTQKQWKEVMGTNPSDCDFGCGDRRPVQNVSWFDAARFMNKLSERTVDDDGKRLTPCYDLRDENKGRWIAGCTGFRFPTEAEWEYACRAGTRTAYSFGDDAAQLGKYAWFDGNSGGKVQTVKTREKNPWGLHDMHGNVWEWVWDWYAPYRSRSSVARDPRGPGAGTRRGLRGGGFVGVAWVLRSADRDGVWPTYSDWSNGFRCARGVPRASTP